MTTPTVPVTVDLAAMGGPVLAGVTVRATLDANEVYGGIVIAMRVDAVTNGSGVAVLNLFPNAPAPAGLGTQGTSYRFTATIPGGRSLNVDARVPNAPCRLENILVTEEVGPLSAAELALLQAQSSVTTVAAQASAASASAAAAAGSAGTAGTKATEAAGSATTAGGHAANAAVAAAAAAASAVASDASAGSAAASAAAAAAAVAGGGGTGVDPASLADVASLTGAERVAVKQASNMRGMDVNVLKNYLLNGGKDAAFNIATAITAAFGTKFGYSGAIGVGGGAVVQGNNKSQPVTLNCAAGQVTLNAQALAAGQSVSFVLNNSYIAADDEVYVWKKGGGTAGAYQVYVDSVSSAGGACTVLVKNNTAGSLSEALVIGFSVRSAAIFPVTGNGGGPSMLVGMNLGPATFFTPNLPFANIFWNQTSLWRRFDDASDAIWPNQNQGLISGATGTMKFYKTLITSDSGVPSQTFRFKNPDGCTFGFGTGSSNSNIVALSTAVGYTDVPYVAGTTLYCQVQGNVTNTAGTPAGGPALVLPGHEASWLAGDYFNAAMISFHQALGTKVFRFMDWFATNGNLAANWADRCVLGKMDFFSPGSGTYCVPYEVAISLCNRLGADFWLNIPARATTGASSYVSSLMTLVASTLNGALSIYSERGNEVWNTLGTFNQATTWIEFLTFTKFTLAFSGTTFTKTAHGFANDRQIKTWATVAARNLNIDDAAGTDYWFVSMGFGPLYVKVLTANTFELWTGPGGTGYRATAPTGVTEVIACDMQEAGKTADLNGNYAALSVADWAQADAAFGGTGRVKAVVGALAAGANVASDRLSRTGVAARANHVAPAPYHDGYVWGAQLDRTSGKFTPKVWANGGGTFHYSVAPAGSTPRLDQRKAGSGGGLLGHTTWAVSGQSRAGVPVTISVGTPAVVTWDTTAPDAGVGVSFTTTGSLPTGLSAGTGYVVLNPSGNTFQLALPNTPTVAINTTGAGSGTHTATESGNNKFFNLPGVGSLTNGTSYDHWIDYVDPTGMTWSVKQTIGASATPSTTDFLDTYANQKLRDAWDFDSGDQDTGVLAQIAAHQAAIAASSNPAITVVHYEGGSHQMDTGPAPVKAWLGGYFESPEYASSLTHYYNNIAAAGVKLHCHYSDMSSNDLGVTPWRIANRYTDTADLRYQAIAAFAGRVPVRTLVDSGPQTGNNFLTAPTLPALVKTFADVTWTYKVMMGDDAGNFSVTGNALSMNATTGISFGAPSTQTLRMYATDGFTDAYFPLTFTTGNAWYAPSQKFAWNFKDDTNTAAVNPVSGSPLTLTGTAATVVSDGWDINAVAQYSGGHGNGTLPYSASPLFILGVRLDNETGAFHDIAQFGTGPSVAWSTNNSTNMFLDSQVAGFIAVPYDNTMGVSWVYFCHAELKWYVGRNQTVANPGGTAYTDQGTAAFSDFVRVGGNSQVVVSALESCTAANLTEALALVQKVQNKIA